MKPILKSSLKKAKDALSSSHVDLSRSMHILTYLVDDEANIWPCERNILECTNDSSKFGWTSRRGSAVGLNRSFDTAEPTGLYPIMLDSSSKSVIYLLGLEKK